MGSKDRIEDLWKEPEIEMTQITLISSNKSCEGAQKIYSHQSKELSCEMKFAIYLPPQYSADSKLPVIYWLSGLTCDENNFIQKAGAQRYAAEYGIIVVCPDTSPRNVDLAGEKDSYDFGSGAGFYVDAITDPWRKHYKMYSYVTVELVEVININFSALPEKQSIFGHSMGEHGALICALRNPGMYKSVSTFAPICNPKMCPWGEKAFTGYLGDDKESWNEWDATELVARYKGPPMKVFIDQGTDDQFLKQNQLLPQNLVAACVKAGLSCIYKEREQYDFYIASFVGEHFAYHAKHLTG